MQKSQMGTKKLAQRWDGCSHDSCFSVEDDDLMSLVFVINVLSLCDLGFFKCLEPISWFELGDLLIPSLKIPSLKAGVGVLFKSHNRTISHNDFPG